MRGVSLLVPSASIAEVVNVAEIRAIPFAPAWLLGAMGWRSLAVPVVSLEALMGARAPDARLGAKVVVLYPLAGRADWEFFGILSSAEPRPQTIAAAESIAAAPSELPDTPYVAAGLKLTGRVLAIPDMEALKRVFYP